MKETRSRPGAASGRKRSAVKAKDLRALRANPVPEPVRVELKRRVLEIEDGYREVAQRMGQLYMFADQQGLAFLTRYLDQPMRHASDIEQAMVSIIDGLQLNAGGPLAGSR